MSHQPHSDRRPARVLIVDDNPGIHADFKKILTDGHNTTNLRLAGLQDALFGSSRNDSDTNGFRLDDAYQGEEALQMVKQALAEEDPYQLAFVDVRMPPGWDGIETLEKIWQVDPDLQAVICSAYSDYSWKDMTQRFERQDNLVILKKPFEMIEVIQLAHALTRKWQMEGEARLRMEDLDRMVRERTRELSTANARLEAEMAERERVREALRLSEERFSTAFYSSPMPAAILSHPEGRFLDVNSNFASLAGYPPERLRNTTAAELGLWPDDVSRRLAALQPGQSIRNRAGSMSVSDGEQLEVLLWAEPIQLQSGPCVLLVIEDVTSQLKLEAQLRQTQKMEAVGRLAAGVAHEFNNILTVIQGNAGLLNARSDDPKMVADFSGRIVLASKRAAKLVSQLLTFSREQPLALKPMDLSRLVASTQKMLVQLLGERHETVFQFADDLPPALADETSVEQVLVNLCLNARDAMPDGGVIRIETSLHVFDAQVARRNPDARAGTFLCLSVTDSGCGMTRNKAARIFDPFFTTKEVGKGTGLGLPTVLGIVRQHQGWIDVVSEEQRGSTFNVYLPAAHTAEAPAFTEACFPVSDPASGCGELILVVEDEPAVRELARATLERGGYGVLEARDAESALAVCEKSKAPISLLVTDLVLPNGNGGDLSLRLQESHPGLPVIYISGYGSEIIRENLPQKLRTGVNFLPKPFDPYSLLRAVQTSLSKASEPAPSELATV